VLNSRRRIKASLKQKNRKIELAVFIDYLVYLKISKDGFYHIKRFKNVNKNELFLD
jgi:hypothetical protein